MQWLLLLVPLGLWLLSVRYLLPMRAVRLRLGTLLSADATTLAPATDANQVALVIAPFTVSETLVIGDLTLGSTNGLVPIACATGAQEVAIDPATGAQIITLVPGAASGFRWVTSGSFSDPITVYGFVLINDAGDTVLGAQQLPAPRTFNVAGYELDLNPIKIAFLQQPMS